MRECNGGDSGLLQPIDKFAGRFLHLQETNSALLTEGMEITF
jgi:hypothetical protein